MGPIKIEDGWHGLWYRIGARARNAWQIFFDIVIKHYSESHRHYHDYSHIIHILKEFKTVRHLCKNPDAVEMFLICHDLMYRIGAEDNEKQSAELTEKNILIPARLPAHTSAGFIKETKRLIMLSKDHLVEAGDVDGALAIGLDLSILGQAPDVFDVYERNVWKEYVWEGKMSEQNYRIERQQVLERFLERKPIYVSPYFQKKYEKKARANIKRSIKQLKAA